MWSIVGLVGWREARRCGTKCTFEGLHTVGRIFNSRHFDQKISKE
jgi:hypothetical protein